MAGFRSNLRGCVAAVGVPYGYTITIWSSGAVSMDVLGDPHLLAALLYLTGAALGYFVVATAAYGAVGALLGDERAETLAWGNVHLVSGAVAIVAVWGMDHALARHVVGWAFAGFLATSLYLTLSALQVTLGRPRR